MTLECGADRMIAWTVLEQRLVRCMRFGETEIHLKIKCGLAH